MLVLTRKTGGQVRIGDDIHIAILSIQGGQVRIGIKAPDHVRIERDNAGGRPPKRVDMKT